MAHGIVNCFDRYNKLEHPSNKSQVLSKDDLSQVSSHSSFSLEEGTVEHTTEW